MLQSPTDHRPPKMSLLSKCKRGNLEEVKAALSKGQLDKMTCAEKLACVRAVNPHKKNAALMKTLLGHLDIDRFGKIMEQICHISEGHPTTVTLESTPEDFSSFLSFHNVCSKQMPFPIKLTKDCITLHHIMQHSNKGEENINQTCKYPYFINTYIISILFPSYVYIQKDSI